MKTTIVILIFISTITMFSSCYSKKFNERYNKKISDTLPYSQDSIDKELTVEYLRQKLDRQFLLILDDCLNYESLFDKPDCLPRAVLNPSIIMAASINKMPELDNIVTLFFLKAYFNNITGKSDFKNVSCCFADNPILLLYTEHFFRMSGFNPLEGWFTIDVYNWAIKQERFWQNEEIKKVFKQIQKELDKQ